MTITKNVEDAINKQINAEFYSAYLYLAMEAHFSSANLKGFANWMRVQALEETTHAMKLFDHLTERGGKVVLQNIIAPKKEWKDSLEIFEESYRHEVAVTKMIHNLIDVAEKEKDRASMAFLQWYVDEQVEEEASADEIRQKLILIKDNPASIFLIDQELAQRAFTNGAMVASSITAKKAMKAGTGAN